MYAKVEEIAHRSPKLDYAGLQSMETAIGKFSYTAIIFSKSETLENIISNLNVLHLN